MSMEMEEENTNTFEEEVNPLGGEADPTEDETNMDQEMSEMFDGPIPGASLTEELGTEPNERPPQFVVPDEALNYVLTSISTADAFERIVIASKLDIPLELTARSIVFAGWALGKYSHDVMQLIYGPVLSEMMDMLDEAGVKYIPLAERKTDPTLDEAMDLLEEYEEFKGESKDTEAKELDEETDEVEEEPKEEIEVPDTGLMGRRE
jgi:hypothetical protein